jgi:choline dehydrogenase
MNFDYVIVGGGSAGCVLADRLSADGQHTVLLLEAGGEANSPWLKLPAGYAKAYFNPALNWMYRTAPQPTLNGRTVYAPRGKVLGGSGAINAMIYVRGQPSDFDDWRDRGNPGWGWSDVEPVFQRLEDAPAGDPARRGRGGPIGITSMRGQTHPIVDDFLAACHELDLPLTPDYNGAQFEGAAIYDINVRRGMRSAPHVTHLRAARRRPGLSVWSHTHAVGLLWDEGLQVSGVEMMRGDRVERVYARREVIVAAGAVGSPLLLQRSGVGDGRWLHDIGVPVRHHLPAVGENLQDHLCVSHYYEANRPTLNDVLRPWWGQAWAALQWGLSRRGPLALSVNQSGGFFRGQAGVAVPNLQLYFNPLSYHIPDDPRAGLRPDPGSGFLMAFNACRPTSRGTVRLAGPDPHAQPLIDPRYLDTAHDIDEALQGMRFLRQLAATQSLRRITRHETAPGPSVQTDEQLLDHFRAHSGSIYHLCGSCTMGPDPQQAVVDARLRVHGVRGLRVVDASVFPSIPSGNIHAPTIMVADRAADLILADARRA